MNDLVAIVEGQTEQTFVRNQLAPYLGDRGVAIRAVLSGKTRKQGGIRKWEVSRNDIIRTLKEGCYCTTMFDFYAMPNDWPGRMEAARLPWAERGLCVETAMLNDIVEQLGEGFNPSQLIPYVQVHEFEALMFCDIRILAELSASLTRQPADYFQKQFDKILTEAGNAEAIDDGYETCPSRRIMRLTPGYRKGLHGPIVAQRIGLDALRAGCAHFSSWLKKLEMARSTP